MGKYEKHELLNLIIQLFRAQQKTKQGICIRMYKQIYVYIVDTKK